MRKLLAFTMLATVTLATSAMAADKVDWSKCKAETDKWCTGISGDENIYQCLLKHDSELSKPCDEQHGKYEELTGKKK